MQNASVKWLGKVSNIYEFSPTNHRFRVATQHECLITNSNMRMCV